MPPARLIPVLSRFSRADTGATAIEYALIAAVISIFIITAVLYVGAGVNTTYNVLINAMSGVFGN
jgi:pilus assembly protein Flp/PilA